MGSSDWSMITHLPVTEANTDPNIESLNHMGVVRLHYNYLSGY